MKQDAEKQDTHLEKAELDRQKISQLTAAPFGTDGSIEMRDANGPAKGRQNTGLDWQRIGARNGNIKFLEILGATWQMIEGRWAVMTMAYICGVDVRRVSGVQSAIGGDCFWLLGRISSLSILLMACLCFGGKCAFRDIDISPNTVIIMRWGVAQ